MPSALKAPTRTRQRAVDPVILLPCGWQCPDNNVFLQRFQLCDELDWEAPLKDRVCTSSPASCGMDSKPIQDPWRDLSAIKGLLERVGRIKLHVHYVYTEIQHLRGGSFWEQSNIPEARNKRLNLEMFIRTAVLNSPSSVDFHFSLGSELADAQDYFDSMGVKCSDRREDILPRLPNVFVHHPRVQVATDLVFHADWLQKHVKVRRGIEEYVVLISDKMRGPFLEPGYLEQMRESLSSTSGVPPWFAPFLSKFARNRRLGVVGTMLSQEVSPHVQSDFLAFKVDSRDFASMMSSNFKFAQQAGKQKGVPEEELGLSTRVLAGGFALGSMFPAMDNFTFRHGLCAQKLDDPLGALPEDTLRQYASGLCRDIKHACLAVGLRLSGGSTPYTSVVSGPDPFPNPVKFFAGPVEKVVFALHGGELWQDGSIPADLRIDVEEKTKSALGLRPEQFGGYLRRFAPGTPQGCPRRF